MKNLLLSFLLILSFFPAEAQPDSVQILETTGDSLLAAGDFEAASRAYFYAFYKRPDSRRLEEKFQFLGLEKHFGVEKISQIKAQYFLITARENFVLHNYKKALKYFQLAQNTLPASVKKAELSHLKNIYELKAKAGRCAHKLLIDSAIYFYEKAMDLDKNPIFARQIHYLNRLDSLKKNGLIGTTFVQVELKIKTYLWDEFAETEYSIRDLPSGALCCFVTDSLYIAFLPIGKYRITERNFGKRILHWNRDFEIKTPENQSIEKQSHDYINHTIFNNVNFETKNHFLEGDKNFEHLKAVLDFMTYYPELFIQLIGHTAISPEDGKTQAEKLLLSKRRVLETAKFLTDRGVAPYRFVTMYLGATTPMVREITEADISINRRVEFEMERSFLFFESSQE